MHASRGRPVRLAPGCAACMRNSARPLADARGTTRRSKPKRARRRRVFVDALAAGGIVKAMRVPDGQRISNARVKAKGDVAGVPLRAPHAASQPCKGALRSVLSCTAAPACLRLRAPWRKRCACERKAVSGWAGDIDNAEAHAALTAARRGRRGRGGGRGRAGARARGARGRAGRRKTCPGGPGARAAGGLDRSLLCRAGAAPPLGSI